MLKLATSADTELHTRKSEQAQESTSSYEAVVNNGETSDGAASSSPAGFTNHVSIGVSGKAVIHAESLQ